MARRRDALPPAERQFLRQKVQQAKWLKQIVDDRRSLLLRTVQAIVDRQWEFLDKGARALQPLTQREIAEDGRPRREHHLAADQGALRRHAPGQHPAVDLLLAGDRRRLGHRRARGPARHHGLARANGIAFTDDELAEEMRRRGFDVQRRTINKYRRMLGDYYALRRSVRRAMNRRREAIG